jgi:Bacterial protein of unknown function (DUF885)
MPSRLGPFIDEVLRYFWSISPTTATALGIHDYDHLLADYDRDAVLGRTREIGRYHRELMRLLQHGAEWTPDETLDATVLRDALEVEWRLLEEVRAPFRDPTLYLDDIVYGTYYLVQREFAPLEQRVSSAARRLREVPRLLRQAQTNLSEASEIPRPWVEAALLHLHGSLGFLEDLRQKLAPQSGAAGRALEAALEEAARAIGRFGAWLESHLLNAAAGEFAIGRTLFDFLLRTHHGLEFDADALQGFGESLIVETQAQLREAVRVLDPRRSWQDLLAEWKVTDHPTPEGFVAGYRDEVRRARDFVRQRDLVTIPEGERLHVVETPPFQRSLCPFAAYLPPGPFERDQDGYFWVTPPDDDAPPDVREKLLQDHLRPGIAGTAAHEAYPGHHLQLSVANGIASKVRRQFTTAVMVEGWGFYSEQLMAEKGFYTDPRSAVLQLKGQLWRACRVIIDVGLQTRGMDLEEGTRLLHEVARLELPSARAELLRYARTPTQPMSYAVGKSEILRLREDVRRRDGAAFRLKEFHDRLLSFGSIPIALIRGQMLGTSSGSPPGASSS